MAWGGGECPRALAVSSSCRGLEPDRLILRVPHAGGLVGSRAGRSAGWKVGRHSSPGTMHCHGRAGDGRCGAPSSRALSPAALFPLPPARHLCPAAAEGALGRRGSEGSSTAALSWRGRPATRQWRRLNRCARGAPRRLRAGIWVGVRVPLVGRIASGDGASSVAAAPRGWRRRSSSRQRKSGGGGGCGEFDRVGCAALLRQ